MNLSTWRKKNRYTQKAVAAVVGVDSTMISKYERELAKPTIFHLAVIHKLTNREVTVEDFLYGNEKAEINSIVNKTPQDTLHCCACAPSK